MTMEWIKKAISLLFIAEPELSEKEKQKQFLKLENQYRMYGLEKKKQIRKFIMEQCEWKDAIFVLSGFIRYMDIDDFKEDVLIKLIQGEFDCYTGSMLEYQVRVVIKGFYQQKRMLHKKNVASYYNELKLDYTYIPIEKRNKNRIIIVTEQIINMNHAPTKMVLDFAYTMKMHLGYDVLILSCPCDGVLPIDLWYNFYSADSMTDVKNEFVMLEYKNEDFGCYQFNMSEESQTWYRVMLQLISAWNPLFVYSMGVLNPVVDLAKEITTLAVKEMNSNFYISKGDISIRFSEKGYEKEKNYEIMLGENQVQLFVNMKIPVIIEKSKSKKSREALGLPENKFLIAIVGNRLNQEINYEFVEVMQKILKKKANIGFVFIGIVDKIKAYFETELFENNIFYLGYCDDLMGTYEVLDLYINPKRNGGGISSLIALAAGIPVVTLPDCDVAYNIGEEFVVDNYTEMISIVEKYLGDKEFYKAKQLIAKKKLEENNEEQMIRCVKTMIDGVIEIIEKKMDRNDSI